MIETATTSPLRDVCGTSTITALIAVTIAKSASPSRRQQERRKPHASATPVQNQRHWRAATYLGLPIGKSTEVDVLRVLGEPKRIDTPADQTANDPNQEVWYVYDRGGEFAGSLTVVIVKRSRVVLWIDLSPDNLSREDAVKHFGPDYVLTRYNFDQCLGNEESAPLYESANGKLLEIEYRHRGIAISLNDDGKVNTISYVSKPIGSRESKCNPKQEKPIRQQRVNQKP